ncbi:hypothetical protein JL720_17173 [Aureococcus anophagefferens]|nr:hypothetical protein JL720_17173 [Aureococcus anophagefferens]
MFIGMEYLRTNNLPLAKHFLRGARKLCGSDPMVLNELGVVELRQGLYADAEQTFSDVLLLFERLPDRSPLKSACESSVFNLAQTYRKMKRFDDAARYERPRQAGDAAIRGARHVPHRRTTAASTGSETEGGYQSSPNARIPFPM